MPLYEYHCAPCSNQFEILRPVSQINNPAVCPSGHTTNNRVLSLAAPFSKSTQSNVAEGLPMMMEGDSCCATDGTDDCACC